VLLADCSNSVIELSKASCLSKESLSHQHPWPKSEGIRLPGYRPVIKGRMQVAWLGERS